jgi:hypothetical protein
MMVGHYFILASLASIKFMFAPVYGKAIGLSFLETYISLVCGGVIASFIFFKLTYKLLKRNADKRRMRRANALAMGFEYFEPKKFTRTNKLVVKTRRKFGFFVCAFFFPFFLSVPVGTIISTKFYGKKALYFPIVIAGLAINGLIASIITYLI